jgi:hypothetical protein
MRHFRRSRRHRSHGYGSYAHHGWYGRDAKKGKKGKKGAAKHRPGMSWQQFIQANKHLAQFRTRKGLLNFKKLSLAWKAKGGGSKSSRKVTAKQKAGREAFMMRLRAMKSAISNIGRSPKKHRATAHHKKRTLTAAAKLRVAERMLWQAGAALNHARSRVAKKAAKAAEKKAAAARKKAEAATKKAQSPAQAKAAAEAAEKAQKEAVAAAYAASQKAGQYDLAGAANKSKQAELFPYLSNFINRDPRRGKKGKKKAKKRPAKKRSSARKSRKMSAATKKKLKAAQKRYWSLVHGFMRKGSTLKGARKKASAAYKKKYGRDFEADFGRDFDSDFDL